MSSWYARRWPEGHAQHVLEGHLRGHCRPLQGRADQLPRNVLQEWAQTEWAQAQSQGSRGTPSAHSTV